MLLEPIRQLSGTVPISQCPGSKMGLSPSPGQLPDRLLEQVESLRQNDTQPRVRLFGFELDAIDMRTAVATIYGWVASGKRNCRFVVTPNVDHAVLYQEHQGLRDAYSHASLILADGMPVVAAARLLGRPLRGRVAGSDLTPAIFAAAESHGGLRVFLLGAAPGVADMAAEKITAQWPAVQVVGTCSPPLGFEHDPRENERILKRIVRSEADLLVVGLGAPKQELWVNAHRDRLAVPATLCVGATIDFLAGEKRRAPRWMRRTGVEWLHRVASEPRRLLKRYARDACLFPRLVWRQALDDHRRVGD
jgi:N-acetylglucosaminyldiphosphoundecaprenol N-acetyl-beta-D-mannosaminyltransferase